MICIHYIFFLWLGEFPVGSILTTELHHLSLTTLFTIENFILHVMINYMPVDKYDISTSISTNALFR